MNDFDQAARYAARRIDPEGFLRWLFGDAFREAWRWAGWLDTQTIPFPGERDRRCDTVAAFERQAGDAPPRAAVIEYMAEGRREIHPRLAEYALRLHREQPAQTDPRVAYDVVGVVINLTGQVEESWGMAPPDCGGLGLSLKARVLNLATEAAAATLGAVASGAVARCVLAWVPLMKGGGEPATVAEWRRLADEEPDVSRRAEFAGLALVFADLAKCANVWRKGLEGWNVQRSQIVMEWEARAELRAVRSKLLRLFRLRLKQELPPEVAQAVDNQADLATLDQWFDQAATVDTLDQARTILGLAAGGAGREVRNS